MSRSILGAVLLAAAVAISGCMVSEVDTYIPDPIQSVGIGGSGGSGGSGGAVDGAVETGPDATAGASGDSGPNAEGSAGAGGDSATGFDGSAGGSGDSAVDGGVDSGKDALPDAPSDAPVDAPPDISVDAPPDAPVDGGADVADADAGPDIDGCVLLLHLDETPWPTADGGIVDDSGFGNNGTSSGAVGSATPGKFGNAGLFDGGSVVVPHKASLQPTNKLTYAAWVFPPAATLGDSAYLAGGPGIISKRAGYPSGEAFTLFVYSNANVYVDVASSAYRFHSPNAIAGDKWTHLAVVFDGDAQQAVLYVNGESVATGTIGVTSIDPSYTADISIGDLPGGGAKFQGAIDEVVIWKRALSAAEIFALANRTSAL